MLAADEPRHPVHGPQFVEHGAADARHTVRLELDAALQVERFDGVHQTKNAGADQVIEVDTFGQAGPDTFGVVSDKGQVEFDELVAHLKCGRRTIIAPELRDVHVHMRHHGFLPDEGRRRPSVSRRRWRSGPARWPRQFASLDRSTRMHRSADDERKATPFPRRPARVIARLVNLRTLPDSTSLKTVCQAPPEPAQLAPSASAPVPRGGSPSKKITRFVAIGLPPNTP